VEKIHIQPEGHDGFDVLFNPTQYSLDKSNQIAEAAIPGLQAPILQYVHGGARSLSMDLFFDTYEERTNVSDQTDNIYNLLNIDPHTHAPPICDLRWGQFNFPGFRGVLDHVSGRFTLFLSDGTPVRATLSVVFKEYIDVKVLVMEQPTHSADHRSMHVVRHGDRLDNIADDAYGDPDKWRAIAEANNLDDPTQLEPGYILIIPPLA